MFSSSELDGMALSAFKGALSSFPSFAILSFLPADTMALCLFIRDAARGGVFTSRESHTFNDARQHNAYESSYAQRTEHVFCYQTLASDCCFPLFSELIIYIIGIRLPFGGHAILVWEAPHNLLFSDRPPSSSRCPPFESAAFLHSFWLLSLGLLAFCICGYLHLLPKLDDRFSFKYFCFQFYHDRWPRYRLFTVRNLVLFIQSFTPALAFRALIFFFLASSILILYIRTYSPSFISCGVCRPPPIILVTT